MSSSVGSGFGQKYIFVRKKKAEKHQRLSQKHTEPSEDLGPNAAQTASQDETMLG